MSDNVKTYAAFIAEQMRILKGKGLAEQTLDEAADDDASKAAARKALKHIRTTASENSDYESALKVLKPHKELHAAVKTHLAAADKSWKDVHKYMKKRDNSSSTPDPHYGTDKSSSYNLMANDAAENGNYHHAQAVKALRKHIGK